METTLSATLSNLIRQLDDLLRNLTGPQYSHPVAALSGATVGQHTRHIIELFEELFSGYHSGTVNYDNRRRSMALQTDPKLARQRLMQLLPESTKANKPLLLQGDYSMQTEGRLTVATNYLRELVYNIEHTVHHMALIRVAVQQMPDIHLPAGFGVAASTLRYQQACAQ